MPPPKMPTSPPSVLTPGEILAHPHFASARTAFIDAVLAFHEGDQFSSRLMVETMRQVTFNLIVILHLRHDVADRSTWPTPQRLKAAIEPYRLASPRRIDALVARLVQLGYVDSRPSELDGRVRLLRATPKMMALDREWLVYNYVPLRALFPDSYSEPIARDPAFQRAQRLVALEFAPKSTQIMASNPSVMRFMHRDAGILVLMKLIRMSAGDVAKSVSYTDIGARFGISRTHVRGLLEEAAQYGDVSLSGRGERLVELRTSVLLAFDRFLADAMSAHDSMYKLARERMGI
jgi:DNA-binding MarR family transcriptional regulator